MTISCIGVSSFLIVHLFFTFAYWTFEIAQSLERMLEAVEAWFLVNRGTGRVGCRGYHLITSVRGSIMVALQEQPGAVHPLSVCSARA
jgi:hypothetical protein